MVITLSFNVSKHVSEVHVYLVTGEHLFITHCSNKVLEDGAVNDLNLKTIQRKYKYTMYLQGFLCLSCYNKVLQAMEM